MKIDKEHFRGCLMGGAVGDAKGYDMKMGGKDLISDNTQMTSFTVDGLLWADSRAIKKGVYAYIPCLFYSYQKWYYTQTGSFADKHYEFLLKGEILEWEELFARRGAGTTSMTALAGSLHNMFGNMKNRVNNSKGCGSVMRAAPIGMYFCRDEKKAFNIGCESGALTHGHIDSILSTGYFAYIISGILQGGEIIDVAEKGIMLLKEHESHEDCVAAFEKAIKFAKDDIHMDAAMEELGYGLTAEEALALALYVSIMHEKDFEKGIITATEYDGNTDSIGSIAGNMLGAYLGYEKIPQQWVSTLELSDLITYGADKMIDCVENGVQALSKERN